MRGPTMRFVCVNDVYSLENLPRLRTLVRHYAETDPADAFVTTLAGDFVAPSLLSSLDHGFGMVDCLDAIPITHVCFGNHEVDIPFEALVARIKQFRGTWLDTNLPGFEAPLPPWQVITVHSATRDVRVGLVGVVTEDPTLYRPDAFGGLAIAPANASVLAAARRLVVDFGCACVVALTHQSLENDKALALSQGAYPVPLIVGGHEHEPHVEQEGSAWIVKAGMDAVYAAVVDLAWPAECPPTGMPDLPTVAVRLEPVRDYDEDPGLRARVDGHMRAVRGLESATLLRLQPGERLSSVGSRVHQTSIGTMLASRVRDALGVDVCLLNGGGIRGSRDYEGAFTYGDLETELPFANEVVVVNMSGRDVREAVSASRSHAPQPAPGYLQVDDAVTVNEGDVVTAIGRASLDDAREYRVATVRVLFDGMDGVEPLVRFAHTHPERVPGRDSGRELKMIVVESFALSLWRELGRFDDVDIDHDGSVSPDDVRASIARVTHEPPGALLVDSIFRALDANNDKSISREEAERATRGPRRS